MSPSQRATRGAEAAEPAAAWLALARRPRHRAPPSARSMRWSRSEQVASLSSPPSASRQRRRRSDSALGSASLTAFDPQISSAARAAPARSPGCRARRRQPPAASPLRPLGDLRQQPPARHGVESAEGPAQHRQQLDEILFLLRDEPAHRSGRAAPASCRMSLRARRQESLEPLAGAPSVPSPARGRAKNAAVTDPSSRLARS